MSEIIKTVKNIQKDGEMYIYEEVFTRPIRISVEDLKEQKKELEEKIIIIDFILSEIAKLNGK